MGDELKELLKEGGGRYFFQKIFPPHMQSFQPYLCMHVVILQCLICHGLAYAITANGVCLQLLVPSLAHCCSLGASRLA